MYTDVPPLRWRLSLPLCILRLSTEEQSVTLKQKAEFRSTLPQFSDWSIAPLVGRDEAGPPPLWHYLKTHNSSLGRRECMVQNTCWVLFHTAKSVKSEKLSQTKVSEGER